MFQVVAVDRRRAEAIEPLGTKSKFWFTEAGVRTLFKAEERGTGEDWAEKVACELAALLGLPHVQYELAIELETKTPGVVCASIAPTPIEMRLGNQLMQALNPAYPGGSTYHVSAHTVDGVANVIDLLDLPPANFGADLPYGMQSALDVFAGYLMLDAWIANQDRHHENWAALLIRGGVYLAPTFDHGASMARNLSDAERHDRLNSKDHNRQIEKFAKRARSSLYNLADDAKPLTTVAAFNAFARRAHTSFLWTDRLQSVSDSEIRAILEDVPTERMSAVCREFTLRLLEENRQRLLRGDDE